MATKTKTAQTVRFLSANRGLRMQRQTQGEKFLPNGNVAVDHSQPEVTYEFKDGALELQVGQDLLADRLDPHTGEVVEQDAIEWLRSTPEYGTRIVEVEPVAPPASDILGQATHLAAVGDVDGLLELGQAEADSWNREDVLAVIADAIERLQAEPASKE